MTTATTIPEDLTTEAYVVVGLATCFVRDDGEVYEVQVAEPIPSATLETLMQGSPTSYRLAIATTLGQVLAAAGPQRPDAFPDTAQWCDDFAERLFAAARTYQAKPVAQELLALGTPYTEFNYSTERKRLLNSERIVRTEDNVKQHEYTHKVL